jgi:hypothetical protein
MNMEVEIKSNLSFFAIFPKCPFNKSVLQLVKLALIALGTLGLYFLNLWIAVVYLIYSVVFYFLAMPLWHCQYCYYKVKVTAMDRKTGKTMVKLLPVDKWKESYLKKHVNCAKKWGFNFFILWLGPIVLIGILFFLSFSIFALMSLIGFIVVLVVMLIYMKRKVCPTCAIVDECHASF